MRRAAGFTLQEIMIVTTLLGLVAATVAGLASGLHRADRVTAAYVEDLAGLRRAVAAVERDLRAARSHRELRYELADGVLWRDGEVVARRIGRFEVTEAGGVATARIGLLPRAEVATREAVIATSVRLGRGEGPR